MLVEDETHSSKPGPTRAEGIHDTLPRRKGGAGGSRRGLLCTRSVRPAPATCPAPDQGRGCRSPAKGCASPASLVPCRSGCGLLGLLRGIDQCQRPEHVQGRGQQRSALPSPCRCERRAARPKRTPTPQLQDSNKPTGLSAHAARRGKCIPTGLEQACIAVMVKGNGAKRSARHNRTPLVCGEEHTTNKRHRFSNEREEAGGGPHSASASNEKGSKCGNRAAAGRPCAAWSMQLATAHLRRHRRW